MADKWTKDPNAVLDWLFDWSDWLAEGETITTATITATTGLTADAGTIVNSNEAVRVWLSGGTAGQRYEVTCRITTNGSRTDDRTAQIMCAER